MANVEISFPQSGAGQASAPPPDLVVQHFDITEGLSRPFEVTIGASSTDPDIDFEAHIGKPVSFRMDSGSSGARVWTGVCSFIHQVETEPDGLSRYVLRIVPKLWLLGQRRNHRAFLQSSAPAIARALLAEWDIPATFRLDESRFHVHEYRVQYGESDLAFLGRTLADAGISYFFEGTDGSPLVLTDAPESGDPRPEPVKLAPPAAHNAAGPHVRQAKRASEVRAGAVELHDFDFQRPSYRASFHASSGVPSSTSLDQHVHAPGAAAEGDAVATRAMLSDQSGRRTSSFSTNMLDLGPGSVFATSGAPQSPQCVVSRTLDGRARGRWNIDATTASCDSAIRPPPAQQRPRIEGISSAIVVGPKDQEIHVDAHGRVRLRFPWDREAGPSDDRTPWVRVAEGWAGAAWGMLALPRVGQEVLVAFLDGDPDQPVVVGRAHAVSTPHPEKLPAGDTKSVWRTRGSPGAGSHHEIAFDDRTGEEQLGIRSARDLQKTTGRDETEVTGLDRTSSVKRHQTTTVTDTDAVNAGDMHVVSVAGAGARREITGKRIALSTGDATILLDGPDILVSGRSGVRIQAGGTVSIQGQPHVQINPPRPAAKGAAPADAKSNVVHYKLVSEGHPLAGAETHVEHDDGTVSGPHKTDANGAVRAPVEKTGNYNVKLGKPAEKKDLPADAQAEGLAHATTGTTSASVGAKAAASAAKVPNGSPMLDPSWVPHAWCAQFVGYEWEKAGADVGGLTAGAASFIAYGKAHGTLHTSKSYKPQVGDAVVYDYNGNGWAAHVAIITAVLPNGTVHIVNGDWGNVIGDETEPSYHVGSQNDSSQTVSAFVSPVPKGGVAPAPEPKPKKTATPSGGVAAPAEPITVGKTPSQPAQKSQPTTHDVPLTLTIVEPKPDTTFELTTKPGMPEITLEAKVTAQGQAVDVGSVRWEIHATGTYHVRDSSGGGAVLQRYVMPVGNTRTTPGEAVKYQLAAPALVGGELEIKATFDGGTTLRGVTASKSVAGCQLLGKNPPVSLVASTIKEMTGNMAWLYLRLFAWESGGLIQFATKNSSSTGNVKGYPLNGPPSGTGLVQRDPEATEWAWPKGRVTQPNNFFPRIFWSWHGNLAEGIASFTATYIPRAKGDLDLLRSEHPSLPPYSEGVLLRAAIRRYNGGTEYVASGDGRHYLVSPEFSNGYVNDVLYNTPEISASEFPIPADVAATEWP